MCGYTTTKWHCWKINKHLLEMTPAFLYVSKSYWGKVVVTIAYLVNQLLSRILYVLGPIESMSSFIPYVPFLLGLHNWVFWCVVFVHIHNYFRRKLDPRAIKCIFIGYASDKNGYHCYHPLSQTFLPLWMLLVMKLNPFTWIPNFKGWVLWKLGLSSL